MARGKWGLVVTALTLAAGCDSLGFRNRVLHRLPSPVDPQIVAVRQEVPGCEKGRVGDRPCLQPAVTITQPVRLVVR